MPKFTLAFLWLTERRLIRFRMLSSVRDTFLLCFVVDGFDIDLGEPFPFITPEGLALVSRAVCVARFPPLAVFSLPPRAVAPLPALANRPRLSLEYFFAKVKLSQGSLTELSAALRLLDGVRGPGALDHLPHAISGPQAAADGGDDRGAHSPSSSPSSSPAREASSTSCFTASSTPTAS